MPDIKTKPCPVCKETETINIPQKDYDRWIKGELIQRAMPYLDSDQRERLITGLHGACWDKYLGPEDPDNE